VPRLTAYPLRAVRTSTPDDATRVQSGILRMPAAASLPRERQLGYGLLSAICHLLFAVSPREPDTP